MISIIIPSYNSSKTIESTLKAIDAQAKSGLIEEVIVADSSNDDLTKKIISKYNSSKIRIIDTGIKTMPAISRNVGAQSAKGEVLAFLDSDVYPADDWIENIAEAYKNGCMVGGGSIEVAELQRRNLFALAQYYLQFNEYMDVASNRVKAFVPSCNMFCSKDLFIKAGGFPDIRAAEDVLFGLKMSKIAQLWFLPKVKVFHIFRENWRSLIDNQKLLGKYILIYRKQYYKSVLYKGIMPVVLLPAFLFVKLLRIVIRICSSGGKQLFRFILTLPIFLLGLLFWSFGFLQACFLRRSKSSVA
ncbi:glycosyltransferase [Candidatus Omnitrophota bacterium]